MTLFEFEGFRQQDAPGSWIYTKKKRPPILGQHVGQEIPFEEVRPSLIPKIQKLRAEFYLRYGTEPRRLSLCYHDKLQLVEECGTLAGQPVPESAELYFMDMHLDVQIHRARGDIEVGRWGPNETWHQPTNFEEEHGNRIRAWMKILGRTTVVLFLALLSCQEIEILPARAPEPTFCWSCQGWLARQDDCSAMYLQRIDFRQCNLTDQEAAHLEKDQRTDGLGPCQLLSVYVSCQKVNPDPER